MNVKKEMHDNIRETLAFSCKLLVSQCLRREYNHSGLMPVKIAVLEALSRSATVINFFSGHCGCF
jgi:hypothetical protein